MRSCWHQRLDLNFVGEPDRFGRRNSIDRVLPANERGQSRWNADPFDVADTGSGFVEMDPGAWLLPYWLARYHNLIEGAGESAKNNKIED